MSSIQLQTPAIKEHVLSKVENTKIPSNLSKTGILFLQLGGPDKLDDVEPFLFNLFSDPDIIRLPVPFL